MKKAKLYIINAVMLAAVNILMRTVSVSFNAFVSNKIGAEAMGVMTLAMSVYGLAVTLATSGINLASVRLTVKTVTENELGVSSMPLGGVMSACVVYSLAFGTSSGAVLYFLSDFISGTLLGDIRTLPSLRALAVSLPFIAVSSSLTGFFTGARKIYKNVAVSLIEQAVKIGVTTAGLVLIAPAGAEYACLAVVGGSAVSEAASLITSAVLYLTDKLRKSDRRKPTEPMKARLGEVAKITLPVAVASFMRQGLVTAEHIVLPRALRMSGATNAGALASYGTFCGMVMPLIMFPSAVLYAFSNLLIPEVTELKTADDERHIGALSVRVFRASLLFSVGVAGIFSCFAYELGTTIYGSSEAARQIRLIAPLIPVMYLDSSVDGILKGLGEQVYSMKINIADAAVSLVLVVLLVPEVGIDGFIVTVYVAETLNAVLSIARLVKVTGLRFNPLPIIVKPIAAVLTATVTAKLASSTALPLIGYSASMPERLAVTAIVYILASVLFRAVSLDDIRFAKRVLT